MRRRVVEEQRALGSTPAGQPDRIELLEIDHAVIVQEHDPRQRARVLVDEGIRRVRDQLEVAGMQGGVDALHRHAGQDEAHAEEIGHGRAIGRIKRPKGRCSGTATVSPMPVVRAKSRSRSGFWANR